MYIYLKSVNYNIALLCNEYLEPLICVIFGVANTTYEMQKENMMVHLYRYSFLTN